MALKESPFYVTTPFQKQLFIGPLPLAEASQRQHFKTEFEKGN